MTARFIGRSICGRTRELAHDGRASKKRHSDCSVVVVCKSDSSGIGYSADQGLLRLTPFPWNPRQRERKHCQWQYKTKRERCLSKLNSFSFSFCTCGAACALSALVIPLGWSVSAPDAHRGHFFRLTLHSLMRFSTLKFQVEIELIFCQIFLVQSDWTEVPQLCGLISQASVERRGVECLHSLHDSNTPILC